MNSSSVRGRMRSASGWLVAGTSGSGAGGGNFEKRLTLFLDVRRRHRVPLAGGFIEKNGGRGGCIQGFDSAGHGNADARVGAALDFFRKAGTFVADEQCHRFAPIDFPGGEKRVLAVARLVHARSKRANSRHLELSEQDRKRGAGENRKMKRSSRRGTKSFWRKGVGCAADAGSGGGRAGSAKGGGGAQDGADVSGILDSSKGDKQRSARRSRGANEVVKRSLAGMDECRDALRVLGVGETFEKTVRGVERGKGHLRPVNDRRETLVMAFAGFAEEHGLDGATRKQRFFDEPGSFDADESIFRGEAAAEQIGRAHV